jgi:hypothetical protein
MSTLGEIEAATDRLPRAEQEALAAWLAGRLQNGSAHAEPSRRIKFPIVECGPPGTLPITEELIAAVELDHEIQRYAASLRY